MPRWRLRSGLVLPVFLVVPLFLAVTGVLWESVASREAETLVAQRQDTALAGLNAQLAERRQANETIAFMLSKHDGLGTYIETRNTWRLLQTMVVMQAALNVSYIDVYGASGERLIHVSGSGTDRHDGQLVARAILGDSGSGISSQDGGLVVTAATTVAGEGHTAGVLVVGSLVGASALVQPDSGEDIAVYSHGRLVDTSVQNQALRQKLEVRVDDPDGVAGDADDMESLNSVIGPLHVRAAGLSLPPNTLVVALVPVDDLYRASQQRIGVVIGGTAALMLALFLIAVVQARAIARPLEKLVSVAGALVRGEYRRVDPSQNHELDALGRAVNELADRLDWKLAELTHQATHDALSGLPNRKLFLQCLDEALAHRDQCGVAVLFLDLDSFKVVNDSLGHALGDQLIVAVTQRLMECLGVQPELEAKLARLGGDEFTILLPRSADEFTARRVAERLAKVLADPFDVGRHKLVVSASIGIAHSAPGLARGEDLLRAADVAMYRAKSSGRGTYVVYENAMGRSAAERLDRETELREAIEAGDLRVYYQPIVDLTTGEIRELEALVRWHHPRRGLVSPAEFIALAEETGLIVPLGRWVLSEASRELRAWRETYPWLRLNVNVSARQLQQPNLADTLREIIASYGLPPDSLTLEITESCLMRDSDARQLSALSAMGVRLAVDDFGTGYSSLAYLSRLPINTLKIDRSFVAALGREPESTAVVETIIALGRALRLSVTAEGIETSEQAAQLQALGCRQGQGFLFARPVPADQVVFGSPSETAARAA